MKNKIRIVLIIIALFLFCVPVHAKEPELKSVWLTCYLPTGNQTASGVMPRRGIMAGKREWIGKTAIVYERNGNKVGNLIGIYEILDTGTGKDGAIKDGRAIDIFCEKESDIIPTQKVWIQIVYAEG